MTNDSLKYPTKFDVRRAAIMACDVHRNRGKKVKIVIMIALATIVFSYIHLKTKEETRYTELSFFKENIKFLDSMNATECKLPQYDLYDPEIKPFIKPPTKITCGYFQPYLTYMDWDGNLHLNHTEVENHQYKGLKCIYQSVIRNQLNDYKVLYGVEQNIPEFPVMIKEAVVRVKCKNDKFPVYSMVHSQILPMDQHEVKANLGIPSHRPSVLIFVIDSMSRGNFVRSLPLTYNFLVKRCKMNVFEGLNKVADNTFPNMLALLAGFIAYQRDDMAGMPHWSARLNSSIKRYDDMPIVWKTFKQSHYFTMYAEEYLDATFSYLDVGFLEDPVDYYYRSSYVSLKETLSLSKLKFWDRSRFYCLGSRPSYHYMLNYTEEFLTEMADMRYFALSFFVEMSHNYLNDVENMDADLLSFFRRLFDNGLLNNTVLLVMGDHGHRFDDIRSTYIGRIEERMPFLGILLPDSLQRSHPHLQKGLESHTKRLLSWYDIHQFLLDLAEDDLGETAKHKRPNTVGKSILRPFSNNRTCSQIGILPEYCMCDREAQIPTSSEKAFMTVDIVIQHINTLLQDAPAFYHKDDARRCAFLRLSRISSASISMKSYSSSSVGLRVRTAFQVIPGGGKFEAAVEYLPGEEPKVLGDINRINKYGSQPSCLSHDILRLYCYCE